jgi:hypothetical protein
LAILLSKQQKPKKPSTPPKPFVKKGDDFRQIYITGAFGNFTPFDFRLIFYTHKAELPDKAQEMTGFPMPIVARAEVVMPLNVVKQLRDMLDRQVREREEMAQELQFPTTGANTWKELKKIKLKISKRDKEILTQDMSAFIEVGWKLAQAHAYTVPSYLGAEQRWGIDHKGEIERYFTFPRIDTKKIKWNIPKPEDTLQPSLSRNEMFEKEQQAFLKLKPSLLYQETYINKFVAVLGGEVVDLDNDIRNLAKRVYSKYGYVPIYIEKVQRNETVEELPSPDR